MPLENEKKNKALFEREQFAKQMGWATIVIGWWWFFFWRRIAVWTLSVETQ